MRNKLYSLINIIGLSIGLACTMLILLYVKDEVSYDRFHTQSSRLYRIVNKNINPDGSLKDMNGYSGFLQGPRFTAAIPEISQFVRYQQSHQDMREGSEIKSQQVFLADTSFFRLFSFPLLHGTPATALKNPRSVVLSEDMARQKFGSTAVVGKTLDFKVDNKFEPFTVTAVAKKLSAKLFYQI